MAIRILLGSLYFRSRPRSIDLDIAPSFPDTGRSSYTAAQNSQQCSREPERYE